MGETYEIEGKPELGKYGFHACENPLDVSYYYPLDSPIHEVTLDGVSVERKEDTGVSAKKITIGPRLSLTRLVRLAIDFIINKTYYKDSKVHNTLRNSVATSVDYRTVTSSTGRDSLAKKKYRSVFSATNTSQHSVASSTGLYSIATNTGDHSIVATTGNGSLASSEGELSVAVSSGYDAAAAASGDDSVAIVTRFNGRVRGKRGCAIVCVERGLDKIINIKSDIVDGVILKEDVWHTVKNGKWVEVK